MAEKHEVTEATRAAFAALSKEVSLPIGTLILDYAENLELSADSLPRTAHFLAVLAGAGSGIVSALFAAVQTGRIPKGEASLDMIFDMMRQHWDSLNSGQETLQ